MCIYIPEFKIYLKLPNPYNQTLERSNTDGNYFKANHLYAPPISISSKMILTLPQTLIHHSICSHYNSR